MVHDRGVVAGERARAAQQPGGRVPAPDRAHAGRLRSRARRPPVRVWGSSFALYRRIWRSNLARQPRSSRCCTCSGWASASARSSTSGAGADEILGGVDYVAFLAPALLATTAMIVVSPGGDVAGAWTGSCGATRTARWRRRRCARPTSSHGVALWHATRGVHRRRRRGGRAGARSRRPARGGSAGRAVRRAHRAWRSPVPITAWSASRATATSRSRRSCASASSRCSCSPARSTRSTSCPAGCSRSPTLTPLYHGVELCRGAVLDTLGVGAAVVHVAVLVGVLAPSASACRRRTFARRLARVSRRCAVTLTVATSGLRDRPAGARSTPGARSG